MLPLVHSLPATTHLFARAGGGGSGGGSGGGGGSIIAAIGYIPAHYVTNWFVKRSQRKAALVAGIIVALLVTIPCMFVNGGLGFLVGLGAVVGIYSGLHDWISRFRKRIGKGKKNMQLAASQDPVWQEERLRQRVADVFAAYQHDWSNFDMQSMQTYLEPQYARHNWLMMTALYQMGRRNAVENPRIISMNPVDVVDTAVNDHDRFSMLIQGQASDSLLDTATGKTLYTDSSPFEELWWFDRNGDSWDLMGIEQSTANSLMADPTLKAFAESNNMFYSLDWGRLLLPQRGQLFGGATFKQSDINNHVIGMWGEQIVQLYTFAPVQGGQWNHMVAQITLPKRYGGIVIRRNNGWRSWLNKAPNGYQQVSMEWPDFNKRYKVYATNADQVTSFELLNPKFMADLYDKQLPFNIEVVDNVVYLYAQIGDNLVSGSAQRYTAALDVLQAAYKELYM
jgi:hypothetical protein